jgi:AcrR family transcriptional regulator
MSKPPPHVPPSHGRPRRKSIGARGRSPGRPSGDSADLRERLLDAAIACFARQGIAATPLRAIAAEAAVTPGLLHYYFGDRGQLQQAVVEERLMPAFESVRVRLGAGDDVAALVAGFVAGIADVVARNPWLPSLWVREVLCDGGALRELLFERLAPQMPQMLAQRFAAAQRAGRLNPGLDPRLLVVSLVGLTLFPAAGAPIWRRMFDAEELDAEALRHHTIALLDAGIGVG